MNEKETMNEVRRIINDFEKLAEAEIELEEKLNSKHLLIEEQKKQVFQMTCNEEKKEVIELRKKVIQQEQIHQNQVQLSKKERSDSVMVEISKMEGKLEVMREVNERLLERSLTPISEDRGSLLFDQLKEKLILTPEEIDQINNYLQAKGTFLAARQQTIKELQECCNKLEIFINERYAVFLEIGNTISNVVGTVTSVATFGVPKAIGETVKSIGNFSKIKISQKSDKEFQLFLGNEDKLNQLNQIYNSLANALNLESEEMKLFNLKYKVFDVVIKDGV